MHRRAVGGGGASGMRGNNAGGGGNGGRAVFGFTAPLRPERCTVMVIGVR